MPRLWYNNTVSEAGPKKFIFLPQMPEINYSIFKVLSLKNVNFLKIKLES